MILRRDLRDIVQAAEEAGWEVGFTKKNHLQLRSPDGVTVFGPGTPSDWRAILNFRAKLRREGLKV